MTSSVAGQPGQGKGGRPKGQVQGEKKQPNFNAENALGILLYDDRKVLKKVKVKKAKKKNSVVKIISEYNHTIRELTFLHTDEFRAAENIVALKRAKAEATRDREAMQNAQHDAMEKLIHIKRKVNHAEQELNDKLAFVLSEKQFRKWYRFQRSRKESLKPKKPDNNDNRESQQRGPRR